MKTIQDLVDKLLFFDPGFIFPIYEAKTGQPPQTQIAKGRKVDASLGFPGLGIGGGGGLQETVTYSHSTYGMLLAIWSDLEHYQEISAKEMGAQTLPGTFWIRGNLTNGQWQLKGDTNTSTYTYEINTSNTDRHTLLLQKDFFLSGLGLLADMESALSLGMSIRVKALVRVLYHNNAAQTYITAPHIILSNETDSAAG